MNKSEIEKSRDERQKRQAEIAELAANDVRDSNIVLLKTNFFSFFAILYKFSLFVKNKLIIYTQ